MLSLHRRVMTAQPGNSQALGMNTVLIVTKGNMQTRWGKRHAQIVQQEQKTAITQPLSAPNVLTVHTVDILKQLGPFNVQHAEVGNGHLQRDLPHVRLQGGEGMLPFVMVNAMLGR